jgi:hypothetical protein
VPRFLADLNCDLWGYDAVSALQNYRESLRAGLVLEGGRLIQILKS